MSNINTGIYIRVSTEEQAINGFSIRAQEEKLRYYAEKIKNWNIYKVYVDKGISGKNINQRPALLDLICDVRNKKINNVLVFKIDRLTRSTKDLIELIDLFNNNNCDFNSLNESIDTTTATGRMFIKIVGIFAEFERENIVERISLGIERKVKEGYSLCSCTPPYGYDRPNGCKTLVINKKESAIVKKIFNLFLKNNSITSICKKLNKDNIETKKKKNWTYKTIKLILTNATYIGKVRHRLNKSNYKEIDGHHEKIIDATVFKNVQKKLSKSNRNIKYDAYCSHILKCVCGCDMIPKRVYRINKQGKKIMYLNYRCNNKKDECSRDISYKKLEKLILKQIPEFSSYNDYHKYKYLRSKNIELHLTCNNTQIKIIYK